MTQGELAQAFEAVHVSEYGKFDRVEPKLSKRPDLHAFLLLDLLCPGTDDIVGCGEHDEIWLNIDLEHLAQVVTKEQILDLVRCGVRFDQSVDSLAMFV